MNSKDKYLAETVLRHLLLGAHIEGIRFGSKLQLLIQKSDKVLLRGQIYLNIESQWTLYSGVSENHSKQEECIPALSIEEELKILCGLREQVIVDVHLGDLYSHLILTLASGDIFFLNGRHDLYECWQVGVSRVSMGRPDECWRVVSCPGGDIAIWAPQNFIDFVLTPKANLMLSQSL
jgi:hypothetical protein